ncbi:MAG TPA: tetratricopeptide repeat protein, partial [Candidatus Eisenbacteria bacterium]|nr:tetratricopeptide repeat protein [Candidatus Eisenbacteria bacterium]
DSSHGHSTWVNWIDALEDCGLPERALAACAEALEKSAHAPELLAFSVPFLSRMGRWEEAEQYLQELEGSNPAYFHQAAHQYHRMRGNLDEAIRHGDAWVVAAPQTIPARYALLDVIAERDGSDEAIERARGWTLEQPGHDGLEAVYCWQLRRIGRPSADLYRVLLRRVRWNPEDAWAWHQLLTAGVMDYGNADDRRRPRLERRIEEFLAQCERTAPDSPTTLRGRAEWLETRGAWREALDAWLRAVDMEPSEFANYQHAWECAARFDAAERDRVWEHMHSRLRKLPGRLVFARGIMTLLAERFGASYAEQIMIQWQAERPEDPNVLEAAADLLIEHGHGRSDAERALSNLLPAVKQFPYHAGLWLSLSRAYQVLGRNAEAQATLAEFTRRHPHDLNALIQLARAHEHNGKGAEAERLLDQSHAVAPKQPAVWNARCHYLMRAGRRSDARALVYEGLGLMPRNVQWREHAVELLLECGDEKEAVDVAREGTCVYP